MPIQHTVIFRLRPDVDETEFLDTAREAFAPIPGIEDFTISRQVSPKSDLAIRFSMVFADQTDYDGYNSHPNHVGFVATRWSTQVEAFQEYDFTDL